MVRSSASPKIDLGPHPGAATNPPSTHGPSGASHRPVRGFLHQSTAVTSPESTTVTTRSDRTTACECVPLPGGEGTECGPRRTLTEQGQDVPAVPVPIREFIADVPAPGSHHRQYEPPTL